MPDFKLIRFQKDCAFMQYVPSNLRGPAASGDNYAVGAVYGGKACGAALAEATPAGCYLRSVFIDPAARLSGAGTLLLRGLLGVVGTDGWDELNFIYSEDMLEQAPLSGCFARAGFSAPHPVSTSFSAPLSCVTLPEAHADAALYSFNSVPDDIWEQYRALAASGEFPPYVDAGMVNEHAIERECSIIAADGDQPAGVILVLKAGDGLHVNGVYVSEQQRTIRMGAGLMYAALCAACARFPGDTRVSASVINAGSYKICDHVFSREARAKYTEFKVSYIF